MKRIVKLIAIATLCISAVACSKSRAEKLALAEGVVVKCTPEVLATVGNKVPVTVSVTYPDGYFDKNAVITVNPVIVYDGGETACGSFKYQGEAIKDNNKVIPVTGATVTESFSVDFKEGMEISQLVLRGTVEYKKNVVDLKESKIADGIITTSRLVDTKGVVAYKADNYQAVLHQSAEGQIMYNINSSNVKKSELNGSSVKALKETLAEKKADERVTITGSQIIAYASPEGGEKYNAKLSDKRAESAQKAWKKIDKQLSAGETEVKSIGQDWQGFQEAVSKSDLDDKNLILRVLSMYSDPAVREAEIKNMSKVYTELKDDVFPDLRRARFITNMDFKNYSEAELREIAAKTLTSLDEEALLRLGAIEESPAKKAAYYSYAAEKFNSQRGFYNLAVAKLEAGDAAAAEAALAKVSDKKDADVLNLQGVIALRGGNFAKASEYFKASSSKEAKYNQGAIDIFNGDYAKAAKELQGAGNSNEALANLLNGNTAAAKATATNDAVGKYISAIAFAREGKVSEAKKALDEACSADASLKARAKKDIEFVAVK